MVTWFFMILSTAAEERRIVKTHFIVVAPCALVHQAVLLV
jgi:hypothetical protein